MTLFSITAIIVAMAAFFSYANEKWVKLPETIGLMAIALSFSLLLIILNTLGLPIAHYARDFVKNINFSKAVLDWMLGFLLFAGSLNIHIVHLAKEKWIVMVLAFLGTIISTFVIGYIMYYVFMLFGIKIPFIYSLLFGALISPTDPIAVLAMLKNASAPIPLQTKMAGESLFNDGVGIVIFLSLLRYLVEKGVHPEGVVLLFLQEAGGGILMGLVVGWIGYALLKTISQSNTAILITLTLVTGGYNLALALNISGPIAMVVAGLVVGNFGRVSIESQKIWATLDTFWVLIDEILNAVLFVLIGLEILRLHLQPIFIFAGLVAIVVVLFARLISVWIPMRCFACFRTFTDKAVLILTWGGLRGALPVAMALLLPNGFAKEVILCVTYIIVVFSILIQGTTMQRIIFKKNT